MKFKAGSLTVEQPNEGEWFTLWQSDPDSKNRAGVPGVRVEPVDALGLLKFLKAQETRFKESVALDALRRAEAREP